MRVRRTCRRMALKLNCVTVNPVDPARAPGGSSDSQPTPVHSAPGGSSAMARPSSSHRAGKAPVLPQASDEDVPGDDSEDSPAPRFADQFIFTQHMDDAPPYTQTQGESSQMNMTQTQREFSQDSDGDAQPRRRRRRDRSNVPSSANRLQTGVYWRQLSVSITCSLPDHAVDRSTWDHVPSGTIPRVRAPRVHPSSTPRLVPPVSVQRRHATHSAAANDLCRGV
nr:unnamed protein product [Digitaria exilis]